MKTREFECGHGAGEFPDWLPEDRIPRVCGHCQEARQVIRMAAIESRVRGLFSRDDLDIFVPEHDYMPNGQRVCAGLPEHRTNGELAGGYEFRFTWGTGPKLLKAERWFPRIGLAGALYGSVELPPRPDIPALDIPEWQG